MTNAVTKFSAPMTVDDFLARTDLSRYELIDGDPRAMSPGSTVHARLQARLGRLIDQHLEKSGGPCWVGSEPAVRPRASAKHNIRVPDLGVTCAPDQSGEFIMTDPILLIELLSPGNSKDTRDNVWAYTTISSVCEIMIVHTTRQQIAHSDCHCAPPWTGPPNASTSPSTCAPSARRPGTACIHRIPSRCPNRARAGFASIPRV